MPVKPIDLIAHGRHYPMALDLDSRYPNEKIILDNLADRRFYEPDVSWAILRMIDRGDLALDIGANAGFFSVIMGLVVGKGGRVLSFEPGEHNRSRLANNLRLNGLGNVTLIDKPVTDQVGEVVLHLNADDHFGNNALWAPGEYHKNPASRAHPQSLRMQATTIDVEIAARRLPPPKLIKIDTEGAEHRVLQGAAGLLKDRKVPYIIAELHEFGLEKLGSSQKALRAFMEDFGYLTFTLNFDGSMPKLIPPGTKVISPHFINLLFSTIEAVGALWPLTFFDPGANTAGELEVVDRPPEKP